MSGEEEPIYKLAIDNGYKVTADVLEKNMQFVQIPIMMKNAVENDPLNVGYQFVGITKEKFLEAIQMVYGEEYLNNLDNKEKMYKMTQIIGNPLEGKRFLQSMSPNLIDNIGLNEWEKIMKFAINDPYVVDLINIANNGEIKKFLESYEWIGQQINNDRAVGVDKLLHIAHLYSAQSQLCIGLTEKLKQGYELNETEEVALETLVYRENFDLHYNIEAEQLGHLIETEREQYLQELNDHRNDRTKDNLLQYLFNMDQASISTILQKDINSETVLQILQRAQKDNNQELVVKAKKMKILIDIIEQIYYTEKSTGDLHEFAEKIYNTEPERIAKIRKEFCNLQETIRSFYEYEANCELTDVKGMLDNPENYTECMSKDGTKIKLLDLSKKRHTLYAHVLSTDLDTFLNSTNGKVTICVSAETDMHEAYYSGGAGTIIAYTSVPKGGYITGAPSNMASNGYIENNNYKTEKLEEEEQRSIRNLYKDDNHSEVLLYREGLIPSGVIIVNKEPTEEEIEFTKELEKRLRQKYKDDDIEIPLIKTQGSHNRVVEYQDEIHKGHTIDDFKEEEEEIQKLRKEFFDLLELDEERVFARPSENTYTIIDDDIYILKENNTINSAKGQANMEAAMNLQKLVHGKKSSNVLDIKEITISTGELEKNYYGIKQVDARNMWKYSRNNGALSPKSNSILLKEFLVDHLMCNYVSDNEAFLLDTDQIIYGVNKEHCFEAMDDFINNDGEVYTSMSYLYFDKEMGNNMYRKIFENYINNPDKKAIFSQKNFDELLETAQRISEMNDDEYIDIFKKRLELVQTIDEKDKMQKIIMSRKENIVKDVQEFIQRLKNLRELEQNPMEIEKPENIAFINDVHGNLAALQKNIEECQKNGKTDIFILGDMIGFGPQSDECLQLIREKIKQGANIRCILGNHELYSLMGNKNFRNTAGFNQEFTSQIRGELSTEDRAFIESMPIEMKLVVKNKKGENKSIKLVHFPKSKAYAEGGDDEQMYASHGNQNFEKTSDDYIIYGHEHRTETTTGNTVGDIGIANIENTEYINLPSSGCVHGEYTTYTILKEDEKGGFIPEVVPVQYEQEKTAEVIRQTDNPYSMFFGVSRRDDNEVER